jgi:ribonucleotide reductase alpha subunit
MDERIDYVAPLFPKFRFRLRETFLRQFAGKQPEWGPVGYPVFKRTYARDLTEEQKWQREKFGLPTEGSEEWWEVCQRNTEEIYSRQRQQLKLLGQHWEESIAHRHAEEFFTRYWQGKFTGSGRMLWFLGTKALEEKGSAPLFNCAAVSTKFIADDFAEPFCWMMDLLMCGAGVGTDVRGEGTLTIQQPRVTEEVFVVKDSREGWVEALGVLLRGYGHGAEVPRRYDLSLIRPAGAPLMSFGGRSGGPEPLRRLLREVEALLSPHVGKVITSSMIADIANMIGVCVVAGGNRRSSEIIIGEINDDDFIALKDDTELRDLRRRRVMREIHVRNEWRLAAAANEEKYNEKTDLAYELVHATEFSPEAVAEKQRRLNEINAEIDAAYAADEEWQRLSALEWAHPLSTHRWASNNAVLSEEGTDFSRIAEARDRNGEPGNVWMDRIQKRGRLADPPMPGNERVILVNPCVTGDTRVMTSRGMERIDSLVGVQRDLVLDLRTGRPKGSTTESGAFLTGSKMVYRLTTTDGYALRLTADHRVMTSRGWVEACKLQEWDLIHIASTEGAFGDLGDYDSGVVAGWMAGTGGDDGETQELRFRGRSAEHRSTVLTRFWRASGDLSARTKEDEADCQFLRHPHLRDLSFVRNEELLWRGTRDFQRGFLEAMFTAGGRVYLDYTEGPTLSFAFLTVDTARKIQQILLNFRIFSSTKRTFSTAPAYSAEQNGDITCCDLSIRGGSLDRFAEEIGFLSKNMDRFLAQLLSKKSRAVKTEPFTSELESLYECGVEDVYDLTEPSTSSFVGNGIVVHNCGEIGLEHHELCNVPETFPSRHDSLEDWKRSLKYAYVLGKTISCIPTHDPKANAVMARNHRLGISTAGIADLYDRLGAQETRRWLDEGYRFLRELDEEYSSWMGVGRSVRLTSVKPGGTSPLLWNVEGGMKWPTAKFYYRLVRIDHGNPLLEVLRAAGYRIEQDFYAPSTSVAYFPVKIESKTRTDSEVSIWEKAEVLTMLQTYWSDNMVSVTLSFRPEETAEVRRVLAMFSDRWKTCSFLPMSDAGYIQAPYTPISEAEYYAATSSLRPMDFGALRGPTHDEGREDRYCDGEVCEVKIPSQ